MKHFIHEGTLIFQTHKAERSRIPRLLRDTLIAMSARRIGAVVYTANPSDFELIAKRKPFRFEAVPSGP